MTRTLVSFDRRYTNYQKFQVSPFVKEMGSAELCVLWANVPAQYFPPMTQTDFLVRRWTQQKGNLLRILKLKHGTHLNRFCNST